MLLEKRGDLRASKIVDANIQALLHHLASRTTSTDVRRRERVVELIACSSALIATAG
jgi:hypothetical protein